MAHEEEGNMSMENQEEILEVTVPLKVEELKRFIENKEETFYYINYSKSDINEGVFLNYLSNLELPCDVILEDMSFEEKERFFKAYMSSKSIVNTESVALNIARILLEYRGIDTSEMYQNPALDPKETKLFIEKNEGLLKNWEHFIESTIVYALYITKDVEVDNDIKSQTPAIDDSNFVGLNIVNMFKIPSFLEFFFLAPIKHELSFFTRQFEEYMFKGNNLYEYFFSDQNQIFALFLAQLSNEVGNDLLQSAMQEA
jgi:hypothetical protein